MNNEEYEKNMTEQNERLLRGEPRRYGEKFWCLLRINRAKIVADVIEAIASLTPRKTQNAWNAFHLYPFYGTPNYTRSRELKLLRQIPKADRLDLLFRMLQREIGQGKKKMEQITVLQELPKDERESLIRGLKEVE